MAVDVNLERIREPGLHAEVEQAKVGVEEVVVEDALRTPGEDQARSPVAIAELDRAAGFLAAQHTDQSLAEAALADDLLDQVFLAVLALQVVVGGLVLRGELFAVRDEDFGLLFQEIQEVGAAQAEGAVHKTVEVGFTEKGQMAFEDHAIKAREGGDKGSGKLGEKGIRCLHGVRLQRVWVSNTTLPAERRLCFV